VCRFERDRRQSCHFRSLAHSHCAIETLHGFLLMFGGWVLSSTALAKGNCGATVRLKLSSCMKGFTRIAAAIDLSALLRAIESGTARISDLIRTVKDYTHLDQAPAQNVDIVPSLETTLSTLAHLLQPSIKVQRAYPTAPLLVKSGGNELNQVWANLIENAIEAMRGRGELRLHVFREDRNAVVEIGDNGPGIPPEIEPHIFDPFFTTKGIGDGTGLGLNTVRTTVRKHGGSIHVNTRPGDTRFQVWLPCANPSEPDLPNG
jgi:signal transduction histidine kinase